MRIKISGLPVLRDSPFILPGLPVDLARLVENDRGEWVELLGFANLFDGLLMASLER